MKPQLITNSCFAEYGAETKYFSLCLKGRINI